jgi:hypothetical protein
MNRSELMECMPGFMALWYRKAKRFISTRNGASKNPEETFSEIYRDKSWGENRSEEFCSGAGSVSEEITKIYVNEVKKDLESLNLVHCTMVDLGCGDFRVGAQLALSAKIYKAVDVVPSLIQYLKKLHTEKNIEFYLCDIVDGEPPVGDVAFLRQVFQHLSNEQISKILPKLNEYKVTYITEHLPTIDSNHPNLDKVTDENIRLSFGSGIYLDKAPFNIPKERLQVVFECEGHPMGGGIERGIIRTYRYTPIQHRDTTQ